MAAMATLYELIEHQPGGVLAEDAEDSEPIEYAAYEEIVVTRAAYEQLIEENARLYGFLARIGIQLDKARYGNREAIVRLLKDKQLQPYLFPGDKEEPVND